MFDMLLLYECMFVCNEYYILTWALITFKDFETIINKLFFSSGVIFTKIFDTQFFMQDQITEN